MGVNRQYAKEAFARYTNEYKADDSRALLKIKHTYKVAQYCEEIAKNLCFSKDDVDVAWLVGLLHDVGRFEQLRRYGTFNDQKSVDHADLAVEILFEDGRIKDYYDDENEYPLIKNAIKMHNKYRVENGFDERTKMFCDIIRDADKLDIFRVNIENTKEEVYEVSTEAFNTSEISSAVFESYFDERVVMKQLRKNAVDGLVCHLSLVYELVFPVSVSLAKKDGYVAKMLAFVSENPATNLQLEKIRAKANDYIDRRIAENKKLDI